MPHAYPSAGCDTYVTILVCSTNLYTGALCIPHAHSAAMDFQTLVRRPARGPLTRTNKTISLPRLAPGLTLRSVSDIDPCCTGRFFGGSVVGMVLLLLVVGVTLLMFLALYGDVFFFFFLVLVLLLMCMLCFGCVAN